MGEIPHFIVSNQCELFKLLIETWKTKIDKALKWGVKFALYLPILKLWRTFERGTAFN